MSRFNARRNLLTREHRQGPFRPDLSRQPMGEKRECVRAPTREALLTDYAAPFQGVPLIETAGAYNGKAVKAQRLELDANAYNTKGNLTTSIISAVVSRGLPPCDPPQPVPPMLTPQSADWRRRDAVDERTKGLYEVTSGRTERRSLDEVAEGVHTRRRRERAARRPPTPVPAAVRATVKHLDIVRRSPPDAVDEEIESEVGVRDVRLHDNIKVPLPTPPQTPKYSIFLPVHHGDSFTYAVHSPDGDKNSNPLPSSLFSHAPAMNSASSGSQGLAQIIQKFTGPPESEGGVFGLSPLAVLEPAIDLSGPGPSSKGHVAKGSEQEANDMSDEPFIRSTAPSPSPTPCQTDEMREGMCQWNMDVDLLSEFLVDGMYSDD